MSKPLIVPLVAFLLLGCASPTGPQSRAIDALDLVGRVAAVQEAIAIAEACAKGGEHKIKIESARIGLRSSSGEEGSLTTSIAIAEGEGVISRDLQAGVTVALVPSTVSRGNCGYSQPGTRRYAAKPDTRLPDVPAAINVLRSKLLSLIDGGNCLETDLKLVVRYTRKAESEVGFDVLVAEVAFGAVVSDEEREEVIFRLTGPCEQTDA